MKIGVIGLGTVGYGVIEILTNEKTRLEKEMKQEIVVKYGCGLEEEMCIRDRLIPYL